MLFNSQQIFRKEIGFKQSFVFTAFLISLGFVLQWFFNNLNLNILRFPVNLILLLFIITILLVGHFKYHTHFLVVWLSSTKAAISSIIGFSFITLLMGFIPQQATHNSIIAGFGLNNIAFSWQYSLTFLYLVVALGFATIKRIFPLRIKNFWYILNHLGLLLAIVSANFGYVDNTHLRMKITTNDYSNYGMDEYGALYYLPFELKQLDVVDKNQKTDSISSTIDVRKNGVSNPVQISVNHPQKINGWNIYFFDKLKNMPNMPNSAVVELIREPWQPFVTTGLILMIVGSFFVFWRGKN